MFSRNVLISFISKDDILLIEEVPTKLSKKLSLQPAEFLLLDVAYLPRSGTTFLQLCLCQKYNVVGLGEIHQNIQGMKDNDVKIEILSSTKGLTSIELNRKKAELAADSLERTVILHGDGLDLNLLEEANISQANALLALTDDDKTNLLTCTRAKTSGCELVLSLVNDSSLNSLLKPVSYTHLTLPTKRIV